MGILLARSARLGAAMILLVLLSACAVRSISNSGYPGNHASNPFYRGELAEFDVLGIDAAAASDAEIARTLAEHKAPAVARGAGIMVVQSGAPLPDDALLHPLQAQFSVTPFSGVPLALAPAGQADGAYARMLRLAAAKSGAEIILCYWGTLESAVQGQPTKIVSWVPIVGAVVPDETQHMRIRLKVAVIDVRSGAWAMFAPAAFDDTSLSASLIRASSDQSQVAQLKAKGYEAAANEFVARFVR
jgi:hypothetical protein